MAREQVELRLMHRGRQRGPLATTWINWRDDVKGLRRQLVALVKQDGYPEHRIGEYQLEIRTPGGRWLRTFTAVGHRD